VAGRAGAVVSVAPPRAVRHTDPVRADLALALGLLVTITAVIVVGVQSPPSVKLPLVGGALFVALLALAVVRYDAAVALGFLLLGFVRLEPAPSDVVFTVVIAVALVTGRLQLRRVPYVPLALVGVLVAVSVLSAGSAVDLFAAVRYLAISVYLGLLVVWLMGYVDSRGRARLVVAAYLVAALVSAALGALPFLLDSPALDVFASEDGFRAQGFFKDPNVYGPFLVPAALILVEEMIHPRLLAIPRWSKFLVFLTLCVALLLAQSRAAWVSFGVGMTTLIMVALLRRTGAAKLRIAVASLIGALLVLGPVMAVTGASDVIGDRVRLQSYDEERFQAQREGVQLGITHPLGVGPGQFDHHAIVGAHSLYIRVFAEQGPVGLLALLLILALTLGVAVANAIAGRDTFGIGSASLLAIVCGLLVNSIVVDTLHWRHLWIFAALVWVGWSRRARVPEPGRAVAHLG
jgi:O-antigen ligase